MQQFNHPCCTSFGHLGAVFNEARDIFLTFPRAVEPLQS